MSLGQGTTGTTFNAADSFGSPFNSFTQASPLAVNPNNTEITPSGNQDNFPYDMAPGVSPGTSFAAAGTPFDYLTGPYSAQPLVGGADPIQEPAGTPAGQAAGLFGIAGLTPPLMLAGFLAVMVAMEVMKKK